MTSEKWASLVGIFTIMGATAALLVVPEVRRLIGLDNHLIRKDTSTNTASPNEHQVNKNGNNHENQEPQPPSIVKLGTSSDKWNGDVPATTAEGIKTEGSNGRRFMVSTGDEIEVLTIGYVKVGIDRPVVGPEGETGGYWDYSVDSPFHHNVGGLEMWVGDDKHRNRYLVGSQFRLKVKEAGIITFRVIDSLTGYKGTGSFHVTVRKTS